MADYSFKMSLYVNSVENNHKLVFNYNTPSSSLSLFSQDENGEVLSPFLPVVATPVSASAQAGRERLGDLSSVSSTSSSMSPLPQSPAQAMAYRGREGSFESRYQSPLDDLRVSQEALLDHMDPQNRR